MKHYQVLVILNWYFLILVNFYNNYLNRQSTDISKEHELEIKDKLSATLKLAPLLPWEGHFPVTVSLPLEATRNLLLAKTFRLIFYFHPHHSVLFSIILCTLWP